MRYNVQYLEVDRYSSLEQTVFRSANEKQCWDFILARLESPLASVRNKARQYRVTDTLGRVYSPPHTVYHKAA
jgi:hypothetical protein